MNNTKYISLGFFALAIVYLGILGFGLEDVAWYLKPLLLLVLIYIVGISGYVFKKNLLLAALVFSWIGDVFLMFVHKNPTFFIGGLLAFLVAHICYIVLFTRHVGLWNIKPTNKGVIYLGIIVIVAFLIMMLKTLLPHTDALQIPVTVYAITISLMAYAAWRQYVHDDRPGNNYVLLGALFFVLSDSILAFNKFHTPVPMASFFIMSTYLIAQYAIVRGIVDPNR